MELWDPGQNGVDARQTAKPESGHASALTKLCLAVVLFKKHDSVKVRFNLLFQMWFYDLAMFFFTLKQYPAFFRLVILVFITFMSANGILFTLRLHLSGGFATSRWLDWRRKSFISRITFAWRNLWQKGDVQLLASQCSKKVDQKLAYLFDLCKLHPVINDL